MKQLIVFFQGLSGERIQKSQCDKNGYNTLNNGTNLLVDIDCCDVVDTCCDNCDA